jgi:SAM-dependent methyltransferase
METTFPCPACFSDAWDDVGTHPYWRAEHEPAGIWRRDHEVRLRRQVLFDVWFPGTAAVTLRSRRCRSCGTICYAPRPTHDDLSRKYEFLRAALVGSPPLEMSSRVEASDQARAAAILAALAPYLPSGAHVLDVGGGDGRLMGPFMERAFDCFLVDRVDHTRPGVRKLADSLEALPAEPAFDAAVCSHVLEHVASPRELLEQIHARLRQGGTAYVEVPLEAFYSNARNPIVAEPVEHINFFTPEAVRQILSGAGFEADGVQVGWSSYEGRPLPVIRAVGVKRDYPHGAGAGSRQSQ